MITPSGRVSQERWWIRWTPLRQRTEWLLHLFIVVGVAIFAGIALYLEPSQKGLGTHQQLGLPPCTLYHLTGRPCPSCGLTTSVSALFHGNLPLAWRANPLGFLIVAIVLGVGLNSLQALFTRHTLRLHPDRVTYLLLALIGVWLIHGIVRMLLWQ